MKFKFQPEPRKTISSRPRSITNVSYTKRSDFRLFSGRIKRWRTRSVSSTSTLVFSKMGKKTERIYARVAQLNFFFNVFDINFLLLYNMSEVCVCVALVCALRIPCENTVLCAILQRLCVCLCCDLSIYIYLGFKWQIFNSSYHHNCC